jgi:hypothetical protein
MSTKLTSRLSTLDAARTVFFIVVGLAIKQSLGLFAHTWPSKDFPNAPQWPVGARALIAAGYLATVIRFSHGVTLLYGHEKERVENSHLPSASKISLLSLFLHTSVGPPHCSLQISCTSCRVALFVGH